MPGCNRDNVAWLRMDYPEIFSQQEEQMVTWIKIALTLLITYNAVFVIAYCIIKTPIRFWADFFNIRNFLGRIYGIILFALSIPATIIFYVAFWILVIIAWLDIFGTKKSYRMAKFAQQINEEDTE